MKLAGMTGVVLLVSAQASSASALASSTFDDGTDGWLALNGAASFTWVASGGADGGFVQAADANGDALWFFRAPASYRGDQSAAYGGSLSYALKGLTINGPHWQQHADVQLLGGNGVRLVYDGGFLPGADWSHFTVPLSADGHWRIDAAGGLVATEADLRSVLADVSDWRILGDYWQGIEVTGLDGVVLSAVPELPSALALAAGLWVVGLRVRARGRAQSRSSQRQ